MPRYAFTLNPAPYKKWNAEEIREILNENNIDYIKIPKNYHQCDLNMQEDILNSILKVCFKGSSLEWGEYKFEETQLKNYHVHSWFICSEHDVNEILDVIYEINKMFSSGKQHLACYVKEIDNIEGWQKYCRKMDWIKHVKQTYDFSDDVE